MKLIREKRTTGALRGLATFAFVFVVVVFLGAAAFLVVAFVAAFLAAGFSFLGAAGFAVVVAFLAAGLVGSFLASFTGPDGPVNRVRDLLLAGERGNYIGYHSPEGII